MRRLADPRAILGMDPAKRGLAFVFFENGRLLDWGSRRGARNEIAALEGILNLCPAGVIVLEDAEADGSERRPRMRKLLGRLTRAAEVRGLLVIKVSRHDVRRGWSARGVTRKHAVAKAIAEDFPVLEPLVPRPRKFYMDEEARVQVFDAASLVLHACGTVEGDSLAA
jgi:hypothetical protein